MQRYRKCDPGANTAPAIGVICVVGKVSSLTLRQSPMSTKRLR